MHGVTRRALTTVALVVAAGTKWAMPAVGTEAPEPRGVVPPRRWAREVCGVLRARARDVTRAGEEMSAAIDAAATTHEYQDAVVDGLQEVSVLQADEVRQLAEAGAPDGINGRRTARALIADEYEASESTRAMARRVRELDPDSVMFETAMTFATNDIDWGGNLGWTPVGAKIARAVRAEPECEGVLG